MSNSTQFFLQHRQYLYGTERTKIAYRVIGQGPPLLMIHGFPAHGITFRDQVMALHQHNRCIVIDLVGAGESVWNDDSDFSFNAHATRLKEFMQALGHRRYSVVGHDSGGFVARCLALAAPQNLEKLAIINSEIPNHRPPWIPLYKRLLSLPGSTSGLRLLLRSALFRNTTAGFGGCFWDKCLIEGEFSDAYIQPLLRDHRRAIGYGRYLQGIEWTDVDSLMTRHREIQCPVQLIWGKNDPTFPLENARSMIPQFSNCVGIHIIDRARLYVHEERPSEVSEVLADFLRSSQN